MRNETERPEQRILKDEKGTTAVLFALAIVPMVMLMSLAVDYSHVLKIENRMQASLDAAILAAMRDPNATAEERLKIANDFFAANFNSVTEPGLAKAVKPVFTPSQDGKSILATAQVEVKSPILNTLLKRIVPNSVLMADAKAEVEAEQGTGQKVEVGMMIDLTGSMGATRNGSTKIAGLKTAANDLLDILYPTGDNPNVRVAIAPMADYVNAGEYAAEVTGLSDTGSYAKSSNLAGTKQGPFSGSYSGFYGNNQPTGSQHGATSASSGGTTYSGTYCTAGNEYEKYNNNYVGRKANNSNEPGAYWNQGCMVEEEVGTQSLAV